MKKSKHHIKDIYTYAEWCLQCFEYDYPCEQSPFSFYATAKEREFKLRQHVIKSMSILSKKEQKLFLAFLQNEINEKLKTANTEKREIDKWLEKYEASYYKVIENAQKGINIDKSNFLILCLFEETPTFKETLDPKYNQDMESIQFDFYNYWYGHFLKKCLTNINGYDSRRKKWDHHT